MSNNLSFICLSGLSSKNSYS